MTKRHVLSSVLFLFGVFSVPAAFADNILEFPADRIVQPTQCSFALSPSMAVKIEVPNNDPNGVTVNGITPVFENSGPGLKNLALLVPGGPNYDEATLAYYRTLRILVVGSGLAQLIPDLNERGYQIRGLDTWYNHINLPHNSKGDDMRKYIQENAPLLIDGNPLDMPVADKSYDDIWSDHYFSNLSFEDQKKFLSEVARVLKPSGEARITYTRGDEHEVEAYIREHMADQFNMQWTTGRNRVLFLNRK